MPRRLARTPKQGEAATNGMSLVTVPDKARGHIGGTLNVFVLGCQEINSNTIVNFHLLYATVAAPLTIRGGPRCTEKGFGLFGLGMHRS